MERHPKLFKIPTLLMLRRKKKLENDIDQPPKKSIEHFGNNKDPV